MLLAATELKVLDNNTSFGKLGASVFCFPCVDREFAIYENGISFYQVLGNDLSLVAPTLALNK